MYNIIKIIFIIHLYIPIYISKKMITHPGELC